MATGSYEYKYVSAETTTSEVKSQTWAFIGSRQSGLRNNIRNNVPKYAAINSATCTIRIKRDGSSDLSLYHHDVDWIITNSAGSITDTLQSENNAISRNYKTFTYNCLSYMNSKGADAGVATSIYLLSFKASGDLAKKYTYDTYKFNMTFTYPTITVVGKVNNADYGEVVSVTHTLGSPIDIGTSVIDGKKSCELIAKPKTGYEFVKWSDGNTEKMRDVELSEDLLTAHNTTLTYTAEFAPSRHTVTLDTSPEEGGKVLGGGFYKYGDTIIILAEANDGYRFVKWSDGNTSASRSITVTANATYTAIFEKEVTSKVFAGTSRQTAYGGISKQSVYVGTKKIT